MANITDRNTRAEVNNTDRHPTGVTRSQANVVDPRLYETLLRTTSQNVRDSLQLENLMSGKGKSLLMETFSPLESIQQDTLKAIESLDSSFTKYLEKASDDNDVALLEEEYNRQVAEIQDQYNDKVFEMETEKMTEFFDKTKDILSENSSSIRGAILGPLDLVAKPFEEFFNFDLGQKINEKLFGLGKQKASKQNPNARDVANIGIAGAGYLYIANTIKSVFGEEETVNPTSSFLDNIKSKFDKLLPLSDGTTLSPFLEGIKTKLDKLHIVLSNIATSFTGGMGLKGLFANLLPKGLGAKMGATGLGKGASLFMGIGGIVTGVISMIVDGIKALVSDKFGASKVSTFLAGMFSSMDGGIKGMFQGMGKWALIGAGVGSLVPVVGTLFGGLIGAVVGGIIGAIGGEKVAKFFDKVGVFFKDLGLKIWEGIKVFGVKAWDWIKNLGSYLWDKILFIFSVDKVKEIWKGEGSIFKKIGKSITTVVFNFIPNLFTSIFDMFGNVLGSAKKMGGAISKFFKKISDKDFRKKVKIAFNGIIASIIGKVKGIFSKIGDIKDAFVQGFGEFKEGFIEGIMESKIGQWVSSLFEKMGNALDTFFTETPIGKWLDKWIVSPIKGFFTSIGDYFKFLKDLGFVGAGDIILSKDKTWAGEFAKWQQAQAKEVNIDDGIIRPDGSIIRTNPNDTLVALKNIPSATSTLVENQSNLDKNLGSINNNVNVENYLQTLIKLTKQLVEKEMPNLSLPPMGRQDLDLIMNGGLL